jgi:hypothetical protein
VDLPTKRTYGLSNIVFMVLQHTRKHQRHNPARLVSIDFTAAIEPSPQNLPKQLCADPPVGQRIRTEFSNTWRVRRTVVATTGDIAFVYTCTQAGTTTPLFSLDARVGSSVYVSCSMICAPVIGRYTTARMSHSRITMPSA